MHVFQRGTPVEERRLVNKGLAFINNEECMSKFGVFPVLYVDFSVSELICQFLADADLHRKITGVTFEDLQLASQELVTEVVKDLQEQGFLTNFDNLEDFHQRCLAPVINRTLSAAEWQRALRKLTAILSAIHKREKGYLTDEYDLDTPNVSCEGRLVIWIQQFLLYPISFTF